MSHLRDIEILVWVVSAVPAIIVRNVVVGDYNVIPAVCIKSIVTVAKESINLNVSEKADELSTKGCKLKVLPYPSCPL